VFDFERCSDHVIRVRVHPERERRPIAFRAVVVIGSQDFYDFPSGHVLWQHRSVITEELRSVVVDVLDDHRECGRSCFRWNSVVDGQDFHLKPEKTLKSEGFVFIQVYINKIQFS